MLDFDNFTKRSHFQFDSMSAPGSRSALPLLVLRLHLHFFLHDGPFRVALLVHPPAHWTISFGRNFIFMITPMCIWGQVLSPFFTLKLS